MFLLFTEAAYREKEGKPITAIMVAHSPLGLFLYYIARNYVKVAG